MAARAKVIIAGAGIGGLVAALALIERGFFGGNPRAGA